MVGKREGTFNSKYTYDERFKTKQKNLTPLWEIYWSQN